MRHGLEGSALRPTLRGRKMVNINLSDIFSRRLEKQFQPFKEGGKVVDNTHCFLEHFSKHKMPLTVPAIKQTLIFYRTLKVGQMHILCLFI